VKTGKVLEAVGTTVGMLGILHVIASPPPAARNDVAMIVGGFVLQTAGRFMQKPERA
jgi:hypothetical protein